MSPTQYVPRGNYFEEFEIGDVMVSPSRTITEADIVAFCGLSGDFNELHSSVEYAKGTFYEKPVAHGMLGLSIATGLANRLGLLERTAAAFMGLEWKFKRPVFAGDTIHMRSEVVQKKAIKSLGGGIIILTVNIINQSREVVQEGRWTVLMKGLPAS